MADGSKKSVRIMERYLRISPQKLNGVAREVRYLSPLEANRQLSLLTKKGARFLLKGLKSAISGAREVGLKEEKLVISRLEVSGGPTLKRGRSVSRGVYHPILKRTSHLLIELKEVGLGSES